MAEISWERNYNKNYDLSNPKKFNILIGNIVRYFIKLMLHFLNGLWVHLVLLVS
jgi:hypothetical protein